MYSLLDATELWNFPIWLLAFNCTIKYKFRVNWLSGSGMYHEFITSNIVYYISDRDRRCLIHILPIALREYDLLWRIVCITTFRFWMKIMIYKTYPEILCLQFRYGSYKLSQNANAWITNSSIDVWSANSFSFFLLFNWE